MWRHAYLTCQPHFIDLNAHSQTCKSLRATVASRYLWLRLLQSLPFSHAPDLPPHVPILQLCSLDIRSIVIRAVKGYYNWHSLHGPTITRKRVINLPLGRDWECPREHNVSAKLLPGGKFILVHADCGRLGCWDIVEEKWIWRYRSQGVLTGPLRTRIIRLVSCQSMKKLPRTIRSATQVGMMSVVGRCRLATPPRL